MSDFQPAAQNEFYESMLEDFLDESCQLLEGLKGNLVELGAWLPAGDRPDRQHRCGEVLNEMFRSAHTLKGIAAMLGLSEVNNLIHKLENFFDAARKDQTAIDAAAVQMLSDGVYRLADLIGAIERPHTVAANGDAPPVVPLGALFARFERVVRDVTSSTGKGILLITSGGRIKLDKRTIDDLSDPLVHIARNWADHGIEPAEVRHAAGKPRHGVIRLDALFRGNEVVIRVRDDGCGLNPDSIRRKAIEQGIVNNVEAEKMSRRQVCQLIWQPGLSTAEKVTLVSGRGIGMDIVKSKIEKLRGSVDLDSEPGKGTTLSITLPLTLAVLPALNVKIGGNVFALPLESVAEIVTLSERAANDLPRRATNRLDDRVISADKLDGFLAASRCDQTAENDHSPMTALVMTDERGRRIALLVDQVLGEEEIVIEPTAEHRRAPEGAVGAGLPVDGPVATIIDPAALVDLPAATGGASLVDDPLTVISNLQISEWP